MAPAIGKMPKIHHTVYFHRVHLRWQRRDSNVMRKKWGIDYAQVNHAGINEAYNIAPRSDTTPFEMKFRPHHQHLYDPLPLTIYDAPGHETQAFEPALPPNRPDWAPRITAPFNLAFSMLGTKRFLRHGVSQTNRRGGNDLINGHRGHLYDGREWSDPLDTRKWSEAPGPEYFPSKWAPSNFETLGMERLPPHAMSFTVTVRGHNPERCDKAAEDLREFIRTIVGESVLDRCVGLHAVVDVPRDHTGSAHTAAAAMLSGIRAPQELLDAGLSRDDADALWRAHVQRFSWELCHAFEQIDALRWVREPTEWWENRISRTYHFLPDWTKDQFGHATFVRSLTFHVPFACSELERRIGESGQWLASEDIKVHVKSTVQTNLAHRRLAADDFAAMEKATTAARKQQAAADALPPAAAEKEGSDAEYAHLLKDGDVHTEEMFEWPRVAQWRDLMAYRARPVDRPQGQGLLLHPPQRAFGGFPRADEARRMFLWHFAPQSIKPEGLQPYASRGSVTPLNEVYKRDKTQH